MYCRKCGKQIDYDSELCKECQEMEDFFSSPQPDPIYGSPTPAAQAEPALEGNKKEGFSKALTAIILSAIAYFFISMAMSLVMEAFMMMEGGEYLPTHEDVVYLGVAIVFSVIAIGLSIPGLILGIKSIKCFIRQKNEGKVKPIPTLVLGIISTVLSGSNLFCALLIILIALVV